MVNLPNLREQLSEMYDDLLFADGFDKAIVGVVERCGMQPVVCYDTAKCIDVLVTNDGMPRADAEEYFSFNVSGAYMGPNTTMWLTAITDLYDPMNEQDTDPEAVVTDPDQKITT